MKKPILIVAIALPAMLLGASPSFAKPQLVNDNSIVQPTKINPHLDIPTLEISNGGGKNESPGANGVKPKGPKGPPPPRRDFNPGLINIHNGQNPVNVHQHQVGSGF
ncbi:hypothetical protein [Calothrix sp. 336/3]|uniref:hypothetical protein n=1 Tax=Calothrix sp. 336/3 TaxID=1337936 RepID=UPI0004E46CC3|nr:hypothetical protein [Calothrix sp. 336/3]AKG20925.1 hypothetical protein IJ00_06090 [Calothrix sp. 336/3]